MGWRDRIVNWLAPESKEQTQGPGFISGLVGLQTPNQAVYSDMSVAKATREGFKIAIPVYRCTRTIMQAGSIIPWIALDKAGQKIDGHELAHRLSHPNKEMSGQDLMELMLAHLCLSGNALWQPLIVGKSLKELWPIMPDLVQPIPSDRPGEWLAAWQVTDAKGKQKTAPPETFVHFQQMDPSNPYWGIGPLQAAARTVDTDNEAQDTQKISMQNRGLTDGVFQMPVGLNKVQYEEAQSQLKEQYLTKLKRRAPWVVGGATYTAMSMTPVEMDFIASRLRNSQAIAAAFGLDPWWVGDRSSSTYNNVAEARRALYLDVVLPMLDDVRETINLRLAPLYGDITMTYDTSGIAALREDYGKRTEQASRLWAVGVPMSQINKVLELGLEEYEGWDIGYLPMSAMPASFSAEQPEISDGDQAGQVQPQAGVAQEGAAAENIAAGEKLTGVQINAAQAVINQYIAGQIPDTVAIELLVAVGIDRDRATAMVRDCSTFEPTPPPDTEPVKSKSFNVNTEEQKALHWKRVDTRRQAYWNVVAKRLKSLYGAEADEVVRAVRNAPEESAKHQAQAAIESLRPQWEKHLKAICMTVLEDFGNQTAADLGGKPKAKPGEPEVKDARWVFDPFTAAAKRWLKAHVTESVTLILRSEADRVSRIIEAGYADNLTITEISKSIQQFYDGPQLRFNAMRTARTEVGSAAGYGQREAAVQSGVAKTHQWLASRDDRVRDSHQAMDGEQRKLDDEYSNGLMFPGDPSGDPSEICLCRCVESFS
jgi:HK97 family phage portal protein